MLTLQVVFEPEICIRHKIKPVRQCVAIKSWPDVPRIMVDLSETKLNKQIVNYVSTLQTPTKKSLDMIVKNGGVLDIIEPKTKILTIIYFFKLSS